MSGSKTVGRAALVVSGGILASRLLGYLRSVVIGAQLGIGPESSLYVDAFTIPDYLLFLMAGGYLSITLVPILADRLETEGTEAAASAFNSIFHVVIRLMVFLTAIAFLAAQPITEAVFSAKSAEELVRLTSMMRITFISQIFFAAGTLFMAAQYANRRFLIPTLAPLIYNLGIIVGGAIGAVIDKPSPEAFLWGGLFGAFIGNFAVQWWGANRTGIRLSTVFSIHHPAIPEYFKMAIPLMIGQTVVALDEQWPRVIGQFGSEGAEAGLAWARQLNMLPVGVIAQAAGVAAYPFLAGLVARRQYPELHKTVVRSARAAIAVGALAAGLVASMAPTLVRIAYQYGNFRSEDTEFVGELLAVFAISIPFWAAHQVYTRAFYALRRMWIPVIIGTAVTCGVVPAMLWMVHRWDAIGVAIGSTVGIAFYTALVAISWHVLASKGSGAQMAFYVLRVAIAAGLAAYAAIWFSYWLGEGMGATVAGGFAGAAAYIVAANILKLDEVTEFISRVFSFGRDRPELPIAPEE